ncbi:hypothetical protein ACFSYG_13370 [Leeuwenhoekiella polynyae]|uniref:Uncharacterized protein n=1 Tax=Leeuwenhoekiella polynyae TaxID=1550906 RepID=A0A4Q0P4M4_9FLAO|nr:hypothetical protein [Leeuwenhoekiella polynyae]RXG21341.1 hypothetical protein DSM02_2196 [Leeuwenhoekiella polynyae]
MKVLIISSYIFGYIDLIKPVLLQNNIDAEILYLGQAPLNFKYQSKAHHLSAFIMKGFGRNAKMDFRHNAIINKFKDDTFDQILIIHPQYLPKKTHRFLKSITNRYKTFLFDSLAKMPRQKPVLKYFDEVFSYEKKDCKEQGYTFLTNFIPRCVDKSKNYTKDTEVFNISSLDNRFSDIKNIAKNLTQNNIEYEFLIFSKKERKSSLVTFINQKLSISEVHKRFLKSKALLDIQRSDQNGLSFRALESLGYNKKLITTNPDIVTYDFYNPSNILVVDPQNPVILKEFINSSYDPVPEEIIKKYEINSWIKEIFKR